MTKQEFQDKVLAVFSGEPSKTLSEWEERKNKYYSVLNEAICFLLDVVDGTKDEHENTQRN